MVEYKILSMVSENVFNNLAAKGYRYVDTIRINTPIGQDVSIIFERVKGESEKQFCTYVYKGSDAFSQKFQASCGPEIKIGIGMKSPVACGICGKEIQFEKKKHFEDYK